MANKKVLCLRSTQSSVNFNSYNIQQIGIGKAFVRRGYDFDFVTFNKIRQTTFDFYEKDGCIGRVIEKPRIRLFTWGINRDLLKQSFLNQYDIVLLQEYYQIMTYLVSGRTDKAILYSGPYWSLFQLPFMSPIYDLCCTRRINEHIKHKFVKSDLAKSYLEGKGYTNVETLGVALDTERFTEEAEISEETKHLIEFMNNNECILYVGSIDENKNTPFLLDVFSYLLSKKNELKLVIIGKGAVSLTKRFIGKSNDSYANELFARYPKSVMDNVYHVKRVENSQLRYVYPLAKAFLLPSKKEIFGMVMLEAMYLGAPVISSKNGGSCTLIRDENYGQMIPEFDVVKWADAVMRYINDVDYTMRVKQNAKALVEKEYNWDVLVGKIIDACEA